MTSTVSFPSATPNFSLPLLFAGQAQKEFFLNQSFSVIDALMGQSVLDSLITPPASNSDGDVYRIISPATGEWVGHEGEIAVFIGGDWTFISPQAGMRLFDRAAGVHLVYKNDWESAIEPALPAGGTTVDTEARQMLSELVQALRISGLFANPI